MPTDGIGLCLGDSLGDICNVSDTFGGVRFDAMTGAMDTLPPSPFANNTPASTPYLAASPGGALAGFPDAQNLLLDVDELAADGGNQLWGCMPLEQQSWGAPTAFVDAAGELYLAYVDFDSVTLHVRAFASPNRLAWEWSTVSPVPIKTQPQFAIDDGDPNSPLWIEIAEEGRVIALSRRNPSVIPDAGCLPASVTRRCPATTFPSWPAAAR